MGTELQRYLDTTDPPILRQTVVKLADTRRRLVAVNSLFPNFFSPVCGGRLMQVGWMDRCTAGATGQDQSGLFAA